MGALSFFRNYMRSEKNEVADFDAAGAIEAINKSLAVIEFDLSGNVITANQNFLNTVEYTLQEIKGKHHSLFCEPKYAQSREYLDFWAKLSRGEFESKAYKRVSKNKKIVWIQATYNPIFDSNGKPFKIIKFATDVTAQKMQDLEYHSRVTAIDKVQAVIEFNMDGEVLTANENFLNVFEYSLREIQGRHHKIFCEGEFASSSEYKEFWAKLNRGEFESKEYKRLTKTGKEVWIQASYNPIFDVEGKPYKVVKYATNITQLIQLKHMTIATGATTAELEQQAQKLDFCLETNVRKRE